MLTACHATAQVSWRCEHDCQLGLPTWFLSVLAKVYDSFSMLLNISCRRTASFKNFETCFSAVVANYNYFCTMTRLWKGISEPKLLDCSAFSIFTECLPSLLLCYCPYWHWIFRSAQQWGFCKQHWSTSRWAGVLHFEAIWNGKLLNAYSIPWRSYRHSNQKRNNNTCTLQVGMSNFYCAIHVANLPLEGRRIIDTMEAW